RSDMREANMATKPRFRVRSAALAATTAAIFGFAAASPTFADAGGVYFDGNGKAAAGNNFFNGLLSGAGNVGLGPHAMPSLTTSKDDLAAGDVAPRKRCNKPRWKCAPKHYYLYAGGFVHTDWDMERWHAHVYLTKRRASRGEVDYTQERGVVVFTGTWTAESSDRLLGCESDVTYHVPELAARVPNRGLNGSPDFALFFWRTGKGRNKYSLGAGNTQGGFSNIHGNGTVRCPADGRITSFRADFTGSDGL